VPWPGDGELGAARTPWHDLKDITEERDPAERRERNEPAEPIEKADKKDPIEPTDNTEPTEPIERKEPFEAIESVEPSDHSDRNEGERSDFVISPSCVTSTGRRSPPLGQSTLSQRHIKDH
jgi:hypothetical protein